MHFCSIKGVYFFQNDSNLNFKLFFRLFIYSISYFIYSIFSPKLTSKSWISTSEKKLYKLSKLGRGRDVIWTKSKRRAVFFSGDLPWEQSNRHLRDCSFARDSIFDSHFSREKKRARGAWKRREEHSSLAYLWFFISFSSSSLWALGLWWGGRPTTWQAWTPAGSASVVSRTALQQRQRLLQQQQHKYLQRILVVRRHFLAQPYQHQFSTGDGPIWDSNI